MANPSTWIATSAFEQPPDRVLNGLQLQTNPLLVGLNRNAAGATHGRCGGLLPTVKGDRQRWSRDQRWAFFP